MSKYTKDEQTEIVGWAMNLEAAIQSEKAQLSALKAMKFKQQPPQPLPKRISQTVTPVKPDYPKAPTIRFSDYLSNDKSAVGKLLAKKNIIILIIAVVVFELIGMIFRFTNVGALAALGIMLSTLSSLVIPAVSIAFAVKYFDYLTKRKKLSLTIAKNTPEYLKAYNEAERLASEKERAMKEELKNKQEKLDLEYAEEKRRYETEILPQYNNELAQWTASQKMKINVITDDLNENLNTQANLYNETGLIPKSNRSLNDLIWIYEDMSSSEHNLERAIDMLNANKQLAHTQQVENAIHNMNNTMLNSFSAVYSAIEEGNDISEAIYDRLGTIRRDINIGNTIASAQRHSSNKQAKKASEQAQKMHRETLKELRK